MRETDNIREVAALDIDLMGFIFYPESPRFVQMISAQAGIIPDYSEERLQRVRGKGTKRSDTVKRVGVFVDDMPQSIVTRVYNYCLDYVQLHGKESPVMIDNLRRTLVPDIAPDIQIIKAISIRERKDVEQWKDYEDHVDMFLFDTRCPSAGGSGEHFDWSVLEDYTGETPFLLSGGIGPEDVQRLLDFQHPRCVGIDLNSRFESEPAVKDVELLRTFLQEIRR